MNSKAAKNRSFMDTLVALFKNVWLKRGVALLCWGYTGLLIWIAWLNGAFFLEYENPTSLFVVYVFVNIAALALLIYTRRQVITQVNVMILPPVVFATFLLAFGNWYMILPPLVVLVAMFFICTANETLKTVLGTMYLLMYVIGAAAYITITLLMGKITLAGVDLDLRDRNYEVLSGENTATIYSLQSLITPVPKPEDDPVYKDGIKLDPVEMVSIWLGRDYLNMILNLKVSTGKGHTFGIVEDVSELKTNGIVNMLLYHDANSDEEYYNRRAYISVPLAQYIDCLLYTSPSPRD